MLNIDSSAAAITSVCPASPPKVPFDTASIIWHIHSATVHIHAVVCIVIHIYIAVVCTVGHIGHVAIVHHIVVGHVVNASIIVHIVHAIILKIIVGSATKFVTAVIPATPLL